MKGKWQTGAVRHNNNTCHDGAVMGTITREYPRQPQQCGSFFRAEESIFVPSPSPLRQTSFFHQLNHFTPKTQHRHQCFHVSKPDSPVPSSPPVSQNPDFALSSQQRPWIIPTEFESRDERELANRKEAQHPPTPCAHIKQFLWPSHPWGRQFYIPTLIKSPEV